MRYTLKDYQERAAEGVLETLHGKAIPAARHKRETDVGAYPHFSLSAPTGSGKTVIASAVLESLLRGGDLFDHEPDRTATVIWFSDDPALNLQSRNAIERASDGLDGATEIIDADFAAEKLDPGKIYFLNAQRLGKNSNLVRGTEESARGQSRPDTAQANFFDVLRATLEDPSRTVYLVLDEAHRGMRETKRGAAERATIVRRLISGQHEIDGRVVRVHPPIPIVLGVSATIERFDEAMAGLSERTALDPIKIDVGDVQASGLLKDTIILTGTAAKTTANPRDYELLLIAEGVRRVRAQEARWLEFHRSASADEGEEPVRPLLLLQVGDKPSKAETVRYLDAVYEVWPELRGASHGICHVFGEHTDLELGTHTVPYIAPQRVQEATEVRVLLAKTAVSTGWDCPRAEALVSLRGGADRTHITQLLGRLVRSPLARRIEPAEDLDPETVEMLGAVTCLLPKFDTEAVTEVAERLTRSAGSRDADIEDDGTGGGVGRRVVIDPVAVTENPDASEEVWQAYDQLTSADLVRVSGTPMRRLAGLLRVMAEHEVLGGPSSQTAIADLLSRLRGLMEQYRDEVATAREGVVSMGTTDEVIDQQTGERLTRTGRRVQADEVAVDRAHKAAIRQIAPWGGPLTDALIIDREETAGEDFDTAAAEVYRDVTAALRVGEIVAGLQDEAEQMRERTAARFALELGDITEQKAAAEIRGLVGKPGAPSVGPLGRPALTLASRKKTDTWWDRHLLAGADGRFPAALNKWETRTLRAEQAKSSLLAWYRNPSTGGAATGSLGIAYTAGDRTKILRPDFLVFSARPAGAEHPVAVDIVDPHGLHLTDALDKLVGLAEYGVSPDKPAVIRGIGAVAEVDGKLLRLELNGSDEKVTAAVLGAGDAGTSVEELYREYGTEISEPADE